MARAGLRLCGLPAAPAAAALLLGGWGVSSMRTRRPVVVVGVPRLVVRAWRMPETPPPLGGQSPLGLGDKARAASGAGLDHDDRGVCVCTCVCVDVCIKIQRDA